MSYLTKWFFTVLVCLLRYAKRLSLQTIGVFKRLTSTRLELRGTQSRMPCAMSFQTRSKFSPTSLSVIGILVSFKEQGIGNDQRPCEEYDVSATPFIMRASTS